jgi:hypothetical protein
MSTARIRNTISSSTTRTFVADAAGVEDVTDPEDMAWTFFPDATSDATCSGHYSRADTGTLAAASYRYAITVCWGRGQASRSPHVHDPDDANVVG